LTISASRFRAQTRIEKEELGHVAQRHRLVGKSKRLAIRKTPHSRGAASS
jgi:hypothetical protein